MTEQTSSCFEYFNLVAPKYINWDFYKTYLDKEPPFGQIGAVVFLRTYSRFIPELGRREKLAEVVLRVVEFSLDFDTVSSLEQKKEEARELFDCLFNFRGFASGRSYWIGGTAQTKKHGSSACWNCCFSAVEDLSTFSEIFYWLLLGAGVGFSVERKYIDKLPTFYLNKVIKHVPYDFNNKRYPNTAIYPNVNGKTNLLDGYRLTMKDLTAPDGEFLSNWAYQDEPVIDVVVGDSKEGWCNAVRVLLHFMSKPSKQVLRFNYNNIRPKGERIKTFGGRASGHENIKDILERCYQIIKVKQKLVPLKGGTKFWGSFKDLIKDAGRRLIKILKGTGNQVRLSSVDVLDIVNSIGLGVVSGGVNLEAKRIAA